MKHLSFLVCAVMVLGAMPPTYGGETHNLNVEWRFSWAKETIPLKQALASMEKEGVAVSEPAYDDRGWEVVSLPHPVNAHDSFDNHAVDAGEAAFRRGVMIYRKQFDWGTGNGEQGKAFLAFETVRQTVYLWVNGRFAGYYEAGIAPCAFDVTELLKKGENVICVATDNCAARGTKIFTQETIPGHDPGDMSGSAYQWNSTDFNEVQGGLVGNVSLITKTSKTYLTLPYYNNLKTIGTYVTARDFDFVKGEATVCIKAEVRNESKAQVKAKLAVEVREAGTDETGGTSGMKSNVARVTSVAQVSPVSSVTLASSVAAIPPSSSKIFLTAVESDVYEASPAPTRIASPDTTILSAEVRAKGLVFWSPDKPHLYDVEVTLLADDGKVLDRETIRTGFRHVTYDAAKGGLLINGKNVWLTGYAQRSTDEWAAIGVPPQWMQDYDAALIRRSNANFVRWMHVAPKPAPVRAFDKFGIVNVCPAGDKEGDVSGRAWAQRMEAMRDAMIYFRNSPSIVFWEAGNNQISPAHLREMVALKRVLDPNGGRFMGCRTLQTKEQIAEAEYVGTMLHRHEAPAFDAMAALGRFLPMMETEYARQESPRRCWDDFTPPDYDYRGKFLNGGKKETGFDVYDQTQEDFALSTAKEYAEFYGARASGRGARTYSAVAALCWTDSNQHGRQSFSENCRTSGRVDAVRLPKESFDVFRVMQSEDPAVMLVGHWSYPKLTKDSYRYPVKKYNGHFMEETGEMAQRDPLHKTVYAIGSVHCASVELIVNGKSKGVVTKPDPVFAYAFPNVDVTERGTAEVVARDKAGKEIARHTVRSFSGNGTVVAAVTTGPKGWLADGSDIAVIDFKLVDGNGTIHPYASDKIKFRLEGDAKFMGGWNSGVFGEASPVGKDFVNLECGQARVFVKAGRTPGKVMLAWRCANGQGGQLPLEMKPVEVNGGISAAPQQAFPANSHTFERKTSADAVQDLASFGSAQAVPYTIRVNGAPVAFAKGMGEPVKPDDNTGVCCAYEPVLAALRAAGLKVEYAIEPKRIPANKKWLRKLSPTPFVPMVTVKAGGHEIDACAGFTELFIDSGKDKNLTNCEIYGVGKKNAKVVCGELAALIGYIPGVKIEIDSKSRTMDLNTENGNRQSTVVSWPEPTREMKPWVYNWWMGSAVDEAGLEWQCKELSAKGFGGFHVIPIYGAKGYETRWRSYLSLEWMEAFAMAKRIGARHGLGIDLTMGSGWCFGGPWIEKSDGCVKLVKGDEGLLVPQPTGQMVKRAGPGGKGLMMNPFSPRAMDAFLKKFEVFDKSGSVFPGHFYHDSYEYFGAAWSDELPAVFKARRGYDLMEKWDVFSGKGAPEDVARVKCDYRATLDDLIVEEVFPKWVAWCHARGVKTRNEAHGSPVNWLDFYALADIPETEMFGKNCRDILISKFASSAAHVTRKPLVSAESCTWIAEHFTESLAEVKVFIDRLFLAGVNHMFYHGCCYSPVEAPWPGWCFYASLEMNPRNPIWRDVGTLNTYITRCQSIFQTCTPDNDLLVYWPIRDYWWDGTGCEKPMTVHDTKWFYGQPIGETAKRLQAEGYAFDYVSDRMLQNAEKLGLRERYAALEVPPCRHMPEKTKSAVAALALPDASKARREPFTAAGLMFTRFRKGADTVYFLVNQSGRTVSESFAPSCAPKSAWRMDPLTGEIEQLAVKDGRFALTIDAGHSCILCCSPEAMVVRTERMPRLWLDLGEVIGNESVRVTVNGNRLGTLIMPPYRIAIPDGVLKGRTIEENAIVLDVCERGANRIREMDRQGVKWKIFTDINMVAIDYKPFDASNWPVQKHGVKGPIRIVER